MIDKKYLMIFEHPIIITLLIQSLLIISLFSTFTPLTGTIIEGEVLFYSEFGEYDGWSLVTDPEYLWPVQLVGDKPELWKVRCYGSGDIGLPIIEYDYTNNSLKVALTKGVYGGSFIYCDYAEIQSWANYEYLTCSLYVEDIDHPILIKILAPDSANYFYLDLHVDWIGWRQIVLPFKSFRRFGSPLWQSVYSLEIHFSSNAGSLQIKHLRIGAGPTIFRQRTILPGKPSLLIWRSSNGNIFLCKNIRFDSEKILHIRLFINLAYLDVGSLDVFKISSATFFVEKINSTHAMLWIDESKNEHVLIPLNRFIRIQLIIYSYCWETVYEIYIDQQFMRSLTKKQAEYSLFEVKMVIGGCEKMDALIGYSNLFVESAWKREWLHFD